LLRQWAWVLALIAALSGCATSRVGGEGGVSEGASGVDTYDPLEPFNRAVFKANLAVDRAVIKPVAKGYRAVFPPFLRDRFRNFFDNLTEPRVFINDFLQVRINAAGTTFTRFLMNSTFGIAGLFDPATKHGLPRQTGDFGQTLYRWGVGDGPYLVLPFLGPSNLRDTVGLTGDFYIDFYADPAGQAFSGKAGNQFNFARAIASGIDLRSRNIDTLDELEASSIDFYAQLRSITRQRRQVELDQARGTPAQPPPDLSDPGASSN
jgi:phospholipid-binding lipoprotein MlaA